GYLLLTRLRWCWWSDGIRQQPDRNVSPCGRLCWADSQRGEANRSASGAIDQIRVCYQFASGQGARHRRAQLDAIACGRGDRMIARRGFITLLGGAAAWPLAVRGQQQRSIGVLMMYAESDPEGQIRARALEETLQKLGWIKGSNLRIDYRWVGDDS